MSTRPQLVVVIMAGGAGTRFWPASVEARPKQFLRLFGERTLLQATFDRVAGPSTRLVPPERVLVVTSQRFVDLVSQQLPDLPRDNIIGEPMRRDTAAAIALAALVSRRRFGDSVMAVLTADHRIEPVDLFQRTLLSAAGAARDSGALYTIGIQPTYAATGFGYLQRGDRLTGGDGVDHYRLRRFVEKPDLETAGRYLESGEYYWNSGMFVWTTAAIRDQLARHVPAHLERLRPVIDAAGRVDAAGLVGAFEALEPISIDFAVMERADDVRCVESIFDWDDVGGWLALEEFLERDGDGNAFRGSLHTEDAAGNLVYSEDQADVVALVGVRDLVVVRAGGKTLIVHRDKTESIKQLVKKLDPDLR